jgi:hypothetical protein
MLLRLSFLDNDLRVFKSPTCVFASERLRNIPLSLLIADSPRVLAEVRLSGLRFGLLPAGDALREPPAGLPFRGLAGELPRARDERLVEDAPRESLVCFPS